MSSDEDFIAAPKKKAVKPSAAKPAAAKPAAAKPAAGKPAAAAKPVAASAAVAAKAKQSTLTFSKVCGWLGTCTLHLAIDALAREAVRLLQQI